MKVLEYVYVYIYIPNNDNVYLLSIYYVRCTVSLTHTISNNSPSTLRR